MTPMGAGACYPGVIDGILGHTYESCFRCQRHCIEHRAETYLETFRERSLIYRDKGLIIVKNYLLYNMPDNPNQLLSWIGAYEELPRSDRFRDLLNHLENALRGQPDWLFHGLLIPLAEQHHRGLVRSFWGRVGQDKKAGSHAATPRHQNHPDQVDRKVTGKVQGNHPRNQEQEQYQQQDQKEKKNPLRPPPSLDTVVVEEEVLSPRQEPSPWPSPEALVARFNEITPASVPKIHALSPARRKKALQALALFPDQAFWDHVFAEYGQSRFLQGLQRSAGHERFKADFDWLLRKGQDGIENVVKVHDAKYRDAGGDGPTQPDALAVHNLEVMRSFLHGGTRRAISGS
jgi:hypothetical protein